MTLVRACKQSEVPPGTVKFVSAGGKDLVVSNVEGTLYVMDNWCTHEQGNLSEGQLKANVLTCPDHGAQFDVKTRQGSRRAGWRACGHYSGGEDARGQGSGGRRDDRGTLGI